MTTTMETPVWTADDYLSEYGWQVDVIDGQLLLPLGGCLVGVVTSAARGGEISRWLGRHGLVHPVVPTQEPRQRWVFLATRDGVRPLPALPFFVTVWQTGHRIALPPSRTAHGELRWIVPPDRCTAGIPSLDRLLEALVMFTDSNCSRAQLHARWIPVPSEDGTTRLVARWSPRR
jgi:hypothetical protein